MSFGGCSADAHANREFQAYAGTVKSESAAEERIRITSELHDTVGYALTNVIVMMDTARARAREEPESLDSLLADVRAQSDLALNDRRQILHLLRSVEQFIQSKFERLTRREAEILHLLLRDFDNREIAERLFTAEQTVRNHVSVITKL